MPRFKPHRLFKPAKPIPGLFLCLLLAGFGLNAHVQAEESSADDGSYVEDEVYAEDEAYEEDYTYEEGGSDLEDDFYTEDNSDTGEQSYAEETSNQDNTAPIAAPADDSIADVNVAEETAPNIGTDEDSTDTEDDNKLEEDLYSDLDDFDLDKDLNTEDQINIETKTNPEDESYTTNETPQKTLKQNLNTQEAPATSTKTKLVETTSTIPVSQQGLNNTVTSPKKGMTKASVEAQWGQPQGTRAAVGEPPISSWAYNDFTVYFEYNHVIHSVMHR